MSQNKTIVPDEIYDYNTSDGEEDRKDFQARPIPGESIYDSLYRPTGDTVNRTCIAETGNSDLSLSTGPCISSGSSQVKITGTEIGTESTRRSIPLQERVIVGVLFSMSRGLLGEIYPIYLGRNLIGKDSKCDLVLSENSVSEEHAVLYVRSNEGGDGFEVTLTDFGSLYGTQIDGADCRFGTMSFQEGNIVTIGRHYRFVMRLLPRNDTRIAEDPYFEDVSATASYQKPVADQGLPNDFYSQSSDSSSSRTVLY